MHTMARSIITTYPGFRELPRGLKILLLESESFFFDEESGSVRQEPQAVPNAWPMQLYRVARPRILYSNLVRKK